MIFRKTLDARGFRRLGRHVVHDERSKEHPAAEGILRTVRWTRNVPIFDQGELGSCTGNAAVGCLSSAPYGQHGTEQDAIDVYSRATHLDRVRGIYPPEDTGSSGLAVMKALREKGWIKAYQHAFGLVHTLGALMLGPGIVGITWLAGCDAPDKNGIVSYRGPVRGGHEIEIVGYDDAANLVWFANSWGADWGASGYFAMSVPDFALALADHGDATFPVVN